MNDALVLAVIAVTLSAICTIYFICEIIYNHDED